MRSISFLSIIVAATLPAVFSQPTKPILSVCDLIANRNRYAGRIVLVRGIERGGHGAWLVADPACQHELVTRGVKWPNIIYLAYPDNQSKIESYHAPFKVDWKSVERVQQEVERSGFDPDRDYVVKTFEGLLLTYSNLENRVTPGIPGALRLGFGPLGEAPAQLLIKRVKDPTVLHRGPRP